MNNKHEIFVTIPFNEISYAMSDERKSLAEKLRQPNKLRDNFAKLICDEFAKYNVYYELSWENYRSNVKQKPVPVDGSIRIGKSKSSAKHYCSMHFYDDNSKTITCNFSTIFPINVSENRYEKIENKIKNIFNELQIKGQIKTGCGGWPTIEFEFTEQIDYKKFAIFWKKIL